MRSKKGFTLIELLVVIAIIALLMSIMMPALSRAKENARRLLCASNLKSTGIGLKVYSDSYDDKLIPNADKDGNEKNDGIDSSFNPWLSYTLGVDTGDATYLKPIQLGKLFSNKIIEIPDVFYCKTAQYSVKGSERRMMEYYTGGYGQIEKFMPPDKSYGWGAPAGDKRCRANYMYWTWEETKSSKVPGHRAVVVDSMTTVAHLKGSKPYGMNALFHDGHVGLTLMSANPEVYDYVTQIPWDDRANDHDGFVRCLKLLDP